PALLVTPLIALFTAAPAAGRIAHIHAFLCADGGSFELAERDTFHLIPRTAAGRTGLLLVIGGFACFLIGVFSVLWGGSSAGTIAITGMLVVFVGGLIRVYSE